MPGTHKAPAAANPFLAACPVHDATITIGAENTGAGTIAVSIQFLDAIGNEVEQRVAVDAYLSNDANGDSLITTAPSSGVAIGTDGLAIVQVTGKAWKFVSEADGDLDIVLTEASTLTCYLILCMPDGRLKASEAITFA
jgi:hypothetical protein